MIKPSQTNPVRDALTQYSDTGQIPGGVVFHARGGHMSTVTVGALGTEPGDPAMAPDTIMRIASITKPITAAAALLLIEDGTIALDAPIARWLPELAHPSVVRTPTSGLDDVVAAAQAITVEDLLTSRSGWGFGPDFDLPAVQALFPVQRDGRRPHQFPTADQWLRELAAVPMLAQPGTTWLYDTSFTILGILVERASNQTLGEFLSARIFAPLDMADTGFLVPAGKLNRFARFYGAGDEGLVEADDRDSWTVPPPLELGNGGLVGTAPDWARFARMLLQRGRGPHGQILSEASVSAMLTNRLTPDQSSTAGLFLDGQGWGYGGSVDVRSARPWEAAGRFGWIGGTGTSGHLTPSTDEITVLLTQVAAPKPGLLPIYADIWTAMARLS